MILYRSDDNQSLCSLLAASMGQISCFSSNVDDEGELLREEFNNYLSRLMTAVSDKREQEELSIMNNR